MEFGKEMGEELQGEGVWVPKTPAKSIPARRGPVSVDGKRENHVGGSFSAGTSQDSTDLNAMASVGSIEGTCDEFDLNKSPNELGLGDSSHGSCEDVLSGKQGRENHDQVRESECLEGTNGAEACVVGLAESFGLMGCESISRGGVNCGETLSGLDKISFMELLGSTGEAPPGFETYATSGGGFGRMLDGLCSASHFQDDSIMNTPPILAAAPATSRAAVDKMSISFPDPLSEIGRRTTLIYPDYGPNQEKHKHDVLSAFHEDGKFHNDEKPQPSVGSASAAFSTPSEKGNTGRRHKDGVHLNKQSRKKPRKKKYWPKVVFEGTPKKTPKPETPKPSTPKPRTPKPPKHVISEKGSDKKKRKYVRKNSLRASTEPSEDVGVGGQTVDPSAEYVSESGTQALSVSFSVESDERKYVQKNSLKASPKPSEVCVDGQVVDPSAEYGPKSCRRALNFDFSLQIQERDHGKDARMIIHQYQRRKKTTDRSSCDTESIVQSREGNESMIKNSAGMAFGFPQFEKWIQPTYMSVAEGGAANGPRPTNQAGCCYNSLKVYKRIFRVNQCLSNSRKLGPNFPGICKKSRLRRRKAKISAFFIAPYTTMYGTLWSIICAEDSQRILKKRRMRRRKATKYIVAAKEQRLVKFSKFSLGTIDRRLAPQSRAKGLRVGVKSSSTKRSTANCNRQVPNCLGKLISPAKAQRWAPVNDPNSSMGVISLAPLATSKKKSNESTQRLNFCSSTLIPNCNQLPSALFTQALNGRFWNQEVLLADKENMVTKRQFEMGLFLDNAVSGRNKMEVFPKDVLPTLESLQGEFSIAFTDVIERLEGLHISAEGGQLIVQNQNACGTIGEDRAVTLYNSRKRKPPPKVHIDQETMRVWKLLMVNGGEYVEEESDGDKEKWWEEQREVFHGRVNSFIARMHLIQGDRRFSPWKGSVVDSVVGVFLTQNVSDHLSSSAFMSLAAKYPLQSTTTCTECVEDGETAYSQESVGSNIGAVKPTLDANGNQSLSCETELDMGHQLVDNKITKKGRAISDVSEDSTVAQDEFSPQKCQDSLTGVSPSSTCKFSTTERSGGFTEIVELEEIDCLQEFSHCEMGNVLWNESSVDCNISRKLENGKQGSSSNRLCDANGTHVSVCSTSSQKCYSFIPLTPSELEVDSQEILADFTNTKMKDVGDISKNLGCMELSGCESIVQQKATPRAQEATVDQCASLRKCQVLPECSSQAEVKPAKGWRSSKNQQRGSKIIQQTETPLRKMKSKVEEKQENTINWDDLRNTYASGAMETTSDTMDSLDWEAVRQATVDEVADAIKGRGQHRVLAKRIQDFLDRVVRDHGNINLEWLRDVPPDKAKDYLLSFNGLGLKSVECVRLLTLHHHAFPVDTNVGRVAVRLGWVPLQPLPESLQIHLLEQYPLMDTIQIYLWPRLCTLDQRTLYELHYQMITFGKVFCRKRKPNCNACPMRGDCRHFASAVASARLALPGPQEKSMSSMAPVAAFQKSAMVITPAIKSLPEAPFSESRYQTKNCEPIIEHPPSPEPEYTEYLERDIEDYYDESEDDIPTIRLDTEQFKKNLLEFVNKTKIPLEEGDMSKALVLTAENASIPVPKLKDVSRLRTVHYVYELPDSHPILAGLDKREPDDPCPYLLAIWTSGETANSSKPPRKQCDSQGAELCNEDMCFSCNHIEDQNFRTVCGTILIPCRTATRGSFPLNGTYFQVNEVFADDESSQHPLNVPRAWIWNLHRRPLYCGAYATAIFRDLSTAEIQNCFWRGFVCVRAFNRKTRAPVHLSKIFHISTSLGGKRKFAEDE